jgi:hypothetical protein
VYSRQTVVEEEADVVEQMLLRGTELEFFFAVKHGCASLASG